MANIIIADNTPRILIEMLAQRGHRIIYNPGIGVNELVKLAEKSPAEVLVVRGRLSLTKNIIETLAKLGLRVIARHGVGLDNIDVEAAKRAGIRVVNAPNGSTESVAELTIMLMIAAARRAWEAISAAKRGEWRKVTGIEIYGKRLAIIGLGRIGYRVAEIAVKAFNMDVHAYDIRDLRREAESIGVVMEETLHDALRGSDILSLHVPLTSETQGMIGEREIELLNDGAIIINTSRGKVIDEKALLNALEKGKIYAAALDVMANEPPKGELEMMLISHPRVIVTPHIGAQTIEAQERIARILAERIEEALRAEDRRYVMLEG